MVDDILIELWLISERTVQLLNINNVGVYNSVKIECSNIVRQRFYTVWEVHDGKKKKKKKKP